MITKVKEIIDICEVIENKGYNVYVDYHGHVNGCDVRIDSLKDHAGGFEFDYSFSGYFGKGYDEFPIDELRKLAESLKETELK